MAVAHSQGLRESEPTPGQVTAKIQTQPACFLEVHLPTAPSALLASFCGSREGGLPFPAAAQSRLCV